MLAVWWDNLRESCDMRMTAGTSAAICWLLLLSVSPVFSTVSTLMAEGLSWRIVTVFCSVTLFSLALILGARGKVFGGKAFLVSVGVASATALLGVLIHRYTDNLQLDFLSAAFVACGVVGLCLGWALPFSTIRLRKRVVASAAGAICGCILYLAVVAVPQPFALFVGACLPVVSAACLIVLRTNANVMREGADPEENPLADPIGHRLSKPEARAPEGHRLQPGSRPFGRELSAAIALYGMLFVLAGHVLPETESTWVLSAAPGAVNVAAFLLIEIALSAYMVKRIHRENPIVAYRPATILVALAFLLLPFSGAELSIACMAVAFAGFGSFMVFFWIVMGNISQKRRLSFIRVYSQGFLTLLAGIAAGEIVAWLLVLIRRPGFDYVATLSIVSLFLLVAMMWQMSDGSRFANETKEMGGQFFEPDENARTEHPQSGSDNLERTATRYHLSPRETEVLALLLKGRSIPYICDELFIAKSTAQTHVRHIYAKMEITGGRQELIDRIEKTAHL